MTHLLAMIALPLALLGLWGVGNLVLTLLGSRANWAVSAALGLALNVFLGGILNLAHVAWPAVLLSLLAIQALIGIAQLLRAFPQLPHDNEARFELFLALVLVAVVTGFAVFTQLPPKAFNSHDDFQKYFAHPVRMLETGTLFGSPLNDLGSQTLGGQAFLHGYVLAVLPIGYINGVDAVFGLMLMMCLGAAAGWRKFGKIPGAALGALLMAAINPQYVNVSSLYLAAALMAATILAMAEDRESDLPSPLIIGLLYASMFAIKTSFALFIVLHLPFCLLAARRALDSWKSGLLWIIRVSAWACVGLAPWILLHLPNYLAKGSFAPENPPNAPPESLNLFATHSLYYGASFAHYTWLVLLAGLVGLYAVAAARALREPRHARTLLGLAGGATAGLLAYLIILVVLGPQFAGYVQSLRYAIPFVIGASAIALLLAPQVPMKFSTEFAAAACLGIIIAFIPSAVARCQQALKSGSILAFSTMATNSAYLKYNEFCLSAESARHALEMQSKVPPGEPLLVWTDTPFLLDYARNPILDADVNGLVNPWARIPGNVHYVLWQYRNQPGFEGFGVRGINDYATQLRTDHGWQERQLAGRALVFLDYLQRLSRQSQVITNDGTTALFKLPAQSAGN